MHKIPLKVNFLFMIITPEHSTILPKKLIEIGTSKLFSNYVQIGKAV